MDTPPTGPMPGGGPGGPSPTPPTGMPGGGNGSPVNPALMLAELLRKGKSKHKRSGKSRTKGKKK